MLTLETEVGNILYNWRPLSGRSRSLGLGSRSRTDYSSPWIALPCTCISNSISYLQIKHLVRTDQTKRVNQIRTNKSDDLQLPKTRRVLGAAKPDSTRSAAQPARFVQQRILHLQAYPGTQPPSLGPVALQSNHHSNHPIQSLKFPVPGKRPKEAYLPTSERGFECKGSL